MIEDNSFSTNPWQPLGTVPIAQLSETRLQLHWAAQVVASFGNAVLETKADDSQSNLGWVDALDALCSRPSPDGVSVGLRLADNTLLFLADNHTIQSQFAFSGQTITQGFEWLTSTFRKASGSAPSRLFALRDYDMPSHPVAQGTTFSIQQVAPYQEICHWYGNAHATLQDLTSPWTQASPIRCWPHHFDLASLVTLDAGKGTEDARSVGCGMSPGDATYDEPYFYVTPWPYPRPDHLSTLPIGFWHTEGWVGAILKASDLLQEGLIDRQRENVRQFFQSGTQACFSALGISPS